MEYSLSICMVFWNQYDNRAAAPPAVESTG